MKYYKAFIESKREIIKKYQIGMIKYTARNILWRILAILSILIGVIGIIETVLVEPKSWYLYIIFGGFIELANIAFARARATVEKKRKYGIESLHTKLVECALYYSEDHKGGLLDLKYLTGLDEQLLTVAIEHLKKKNRITEIYESQGVVNYQLSNC